MDLTQPHLIGDGPIECSASQTLVRYPTVIVDVNGYYRDLHVDVRATRSDLMRAYIAALGSSSARLTYIIKLLLNPARRRAYDGLTLGELHMDPWVCEAIYQRGFRPVDESRVEVQDDSALDGDWPWAWYRWETDETDHHPLIGWQSALLSHLGDRPELRFAVGLHDSRESVVVRQVGYRLVAFLRVGTEPGLAEVAAAVHQLTHAEHITTHTQRNPNSSGEQSTCPTPPHQPSVPASSVPKKQRRPTVVVSHEPRSSASMTTRLPSSGSSRSRTPVADTSTATPSAASRSTSTKRRSKTSASSTEPTLVT